MQKAEILYSPCVGAELINVIIFDDITLRFRYILVIIKTCVCLVFGLLLQLHDRPDAEQLSIPSTSAAEAAIVIHQLDTLIILKCFLFFFLRPKEKDVCFRTQHKSSF